MRMKKIIAALLACVMLLALPACGEPGSGTPGTASGGSLEVKIWDGGQLDGLQEICDEWTKESGVKVNIQAMGWGEYFTLLEAGASGGQMPDVFWMHSTVAELYMSNDMLLKLDDYIAKDNVDLGNYYQDIVDMYRYNGGIYAMPKDHDTIALLCNKAIFDQYNVEYPNEDWTWEDFYAAAKAITDASGGEVYGYSADVGNNQDGWWNIVYDYGGYIISEDKKSSGMDDPKTLEAMNFLGKLIDDTMPPQSVISETGGGTLFNSGVVAMNTQGCWNINTFYTNENKDNYGWSVLPYYDANGNGQVDQGERCSIYNGIGWAASASTKNPDAAWSLIKWLSSKEMQVKQADLGVTMAGYKGASDSYAQAFPGMDISAFLKMESDGTLITRPHSKYTNTWETSCLPIVTAGAGLAALYYTMLRALRENWEIKPVKTFWTGLKENLRQATAAWLVFLVLAVLIYLEIFWCGQFSGPVAMFQYGLYAIGLAVAVLVAYLFPVMAAFRGSMAQLMKNSIGFAFQRPIVILSTLALYVIPMGWTFLTNAYLPLYAFLWCTIGFSGIAALCAKMLFPLFQPYLGEKDKIWTAPQKTEQEILREIKKLEM